MSICLAIRSATCPPGARPRRRQRVRKTADLDPDQVGIAVSKETDALAEQEAIQAGEADFHSGLGNIRHTYDNQLSELCGTFTAPDGTVYPATRRYIEHDPVARKTGQICGLANGQVYDARAGILLADLEIVALKNKRKASTRRSPSSATSSSSNVAWPWIYATSAWVRIEIQLATNPDRTSPEPHHEPAKSRCRHGSAGTYRERVRHRSTGSDSRGTIDQLWRLRWCLHELHHTGIVGSEVASHEDILTLENQQRQLEQASVHWRLGNDANWLGLNPRPAFVLCICSSPPSMSRHANSISKCSWPKPVKSIYSAKLSGCWRNRKRQSGWRSTPSLPAPTPTSVSTKTRPFLRQSAPSTLHSKRRIAPRACSSTSPVSPTQHPAMCISSAWPPGRAEPQAYVTALSEEYETFGETFGNPKVRVQILSLRDDLLAIHVSMPQGCPMSQTARVRRFREVLQDPRMLDGRGYLRALLHPR